MKIFYNEKQTAKSNSSFSPSAGKPEKAVAQWMELFGDKLEIVKSGKASVMDLSLAHKKVYVEDVLSRKKSNGFGNTQKEVALSLPYTTGSFVDAAFSVVENGGVAVSPTSGFHHACYNSGGGFCTFNGLMVAAIKLKEEGKVKGVGILDLDQHYGNGTTDIIERLDVDYITHYSSNHGVVNTSSNAENFLENELPLIMEDFKKNCDVLLYQAGADCHIEDPLGGWLNTEQMRRRDKIVFEFCAKNKIPVAFNLAGGYQQDKDGGIQKVLNLHNNTIEQALKAFKE